MLLRFLRSLVDHAIDRIFGSLDDIRENDGPEISSVAWTACKRLLGVELCLYSWDLISASSQSCKFWKNISAELSAFWKSWDELISWASWAKRIYNSAWSDDVGDTAHILVEVRQFWLEFDLLSVDYETDDERKLKEEIVF